jgi:hypothetical protein
VIPQAPASSRGIPRVSSILNALPFRVNEPDGMGGIAWPPADVDVVNADTFDSSNEARSAMADRPNCREFDNYRVQYAMERALGGSVHARAGFKPTGSTRLDRNSPLSVAARGSRG